MWNQRPGQNFLGARLICFILNYSFRYMCHKSISVSYYVTYASCKKMYKTCKNGCMAFATVSVVIEFIASYIVIESE